MQEGWSKLRWLISFWSKTVAVEKGKKGGFTKWKVGIFGHGGVPYVPSIDNWINHLRLDQNPWSSHQHLHRTGCSCQCTIIHTECCTKEKRIEKG